MTALLDPRLADKLAKLCGLFSSDHDGERANAAAMADKLLRQLGLTWQQIISVPSAPVPATVEEQIAFCLDHGADMLTTWEWGFLNGIRDWPNSLTAKQRKKLEQLFRKVKAARSAS
jgi:hypothetical protein